MSNGFFKKLSSILPNMLGADSEDTDESDEYFSDVSEDELKIILSYEPVPLSLALRKRYLEEKGFEKYGVSKEKDISLY